MLKLGHYLGPSIDISLAMMAKILTENRQVLHRSDKDGSDAQEQFMGRVYERVGSWVLPRELEGIGLENTPLYDPYEDVTQNKQTFSPASRGAGAYTRGGRSLYRCRDTAA